MGSPARASITAQSRGWPAAALVATESAEPGVGELELELALARVGILELEDQHGRLGADPERPQAAAELVGIEAAPERLREQVAGEAAFGLADHPLAHQLEPDDHRLPGER